MIFLTLTIGAGQNASLFTAVAIGVRNVSDTIEVYKKDSGDARILVNGLTFEMESPSTSELKGIVVKQ